MAEELDPELMAALRAESVEMETNADSMEPFPPGTRITMPNQPSRVFNLRLTEDQFAALQQVAEAKHLPVSTMARAWLLDRLDVERAAS